MKSALMGRRRAVSAVLAGALCLIGAVANAFEQTPSVSEAVQPEGPPLWRIVSPYGVEGYLFGSIHILPEGADWRRARLDEALTEAGAIVLEVDTEDLDAIGILEAVRDIGFYPPGQSLADHLSVELYADVMAAGAKVGVPELALRQFQPWYASVLLATRVLGLEGASAGQGVETALDAHAKATRTELIGLETFEQQMSFFTTLRRETQIALLEQTISEIREEPQAIDVMTEAWMSGDLEAMEAAFVEPLQDFPDLHQGLLMDRNRAWGRQLGRLMRSRDERLFIAVGAAHLVGPNSLRAHLERLGYDLDRL
ncbi:MAG: TraB/GumN family protein [Pseudomonadota bacterium]